MFGSTVKMLCSSSLFDLCSDLKVPMVMMAESPAKLLLLRFTFSLRSAAFDDHGHGYHTRL